MNKFSCPKCGERLVGEKVVDEVYDLESDELKERVLLKHAITCVACDFTENVEKGE